VCFDPQDRADTTWQTMIFATLGFAQIGQALALRAWGHSLLSITANPMMAGATAVTLVLQVLPIYVSALARFFGLTPLSRLELVLVRHGGSDVCHCPSGEGNTKGTGPTE
jgi:Ca2+-transporting ATPase